MADGESAVELVDADTGGISFTDVRFGYGPDREILKGLTFEARYMRVGQGVAWRRGGVAWWRGDMYEYFLRVLCFSEGFEGT